MKAIFKHTVFLILEFFLFLFIALFGGGILVVMSIELFKEFNEASMKEQIFGHPYFLACSNYIPVTIAVLLAAWVAHKLILQRREEDLGFNKKGLLPEYILGCLWAALLIIPGFLILVVTNQIEITGFNFNGKLIFGFLFLFVIQSFSEEVIFRSYMIPTIERRFGTWTAVIISSILFMAIHLGNSGINILPCFNLFFGGILMGLLFVRYRNVWAASGFHFLWNYLQSAILGFAVSGEKTYSWVQQQEQGNSIMTGGSFGYEGSILSVVFVLIAIVLFWMRSNKLRSEFLSYKQVNIKAPELFPIHDQV